MPEDCPLPDMEKDRVTVLICNVDCRTFVWTLFL